MREAERVPLFAREEPAFARAEPELRVDPVLLDLELDALRVDDERLELLARRVPLLRRRDDERPLERSAAGISAVATASIAV